MLNNKLLETADNIIDKGYLSESQKNKVIAELSNLKKDNDLDINNKDIDNLIISLHSSTHFLNLGRKKTKISSQKKVMLKSMFDVIYEECTNKDQAEIIVNKIVKQI